MLLALQKLNANLQSANVKNIFMEMLEFLEKILFLSFYLKCVCLIYTVENGFKKLFQLKIICYHADLKCLV